MTTHIAYALILFVHPGSHAEIHAIFPTAAECRAERKTLLEDLEGSRIVAACVPQNRMSINEASAHLKTLFDTMSTIIPKDQK